MLKVQALTDGYRSCFSYPMIGITNLFIYILKFPQLPSTHSDIALLDMAAGYFGSLDFVTGSELSFSFPREIGTLARLAVDKNNSSRAQAPSFDPCREDTQVVNDLPFSVSMDCV